MSLGRRCLARIRCRLRRCRRLIQCVELGLPRLPLRRQLRRGLRQLRLRAVELVGERPARRLGLSRLGDGVLCLRASLRLLRLGELRRLLAGGLELLDDGHRLVFRALLELLGGLDCLRGRRLGEGRAPRRLVALPLHLPEPRVGFLGRRHCPRELLLATVSLRFGRRTRASLISLARVELRLARLQLRLGPLQSRLQPEQLLVALPTLLAQTEHLRRRRPCGCCLLLGLALRPVRLTLCGGGLFLGRVRARRHLPTQVLE